MSPTPPSSEGSPRAVLEARGLEVRLGRTPVLRGVDLAVLPGDVYGLLGRNGAGKTTTLRCLLGFLPRFAGHARILGEPPGRIHRVAAALGVALDPPGLDDSLTVRQNLEAAWIRGGLREGRGCDEVLELVGLAHRAHHRADRLSHGQTRRAAVARALLGSPRLLVLDEPLSGLDPEGVEEMLLLLRRLARGEGTTVVFSSHHLREVEEVCNRVGVMDGGRLVLEGALAELLAGTGVRYELRCRAPAVAGPLLDAAGAQREEEDPARGWYRLRLEDEAGAEALLARLVAAEAGVLEFRRLRTTLVDLYRRAVA